MSQTEPTRVVVIEDSPLFAEALADMLNESPHLRVVGTAAAGNDGVAMTRELRPGLVTCDLGLPDIDGFSVVTRIMAECPTPIVVFTATLRPKWRRDAYDALALGALEVFEKPQVEDFESADWRRQLQSELVLIARSPVVPHVFHTVANRVRRLGGRGAERMGAAQRGLKAGAQSTELLVIVGSAGAPRALATLLKSLRPAFPLPFPILVGLHLGPHMALSLSQFLASTVGCEVIELADDTQLQPGRVYVCPGGVHTEVVSRERVRLFAGFPELYHAPSLDYLLWSVARVFGKNTLGVILTGMGVDGADGMAALHRSGARTIGQDEASSLVYGMPRAAKDAGAIDVQKPVDQIGPTVLDWLYAEARP